jgi:hypothetical protein
MSTHYHAVVWIDRKQARVVVLAHVRHFFKADDRMRAQIRA